uniref:Uncharacterized protein n=1 Tax=Piliocolobus tephrosceles TaxID=591936 RepID=A0A8C9HJ51_9PRIM
MAPEAGDGREDGPRGCKWRGDPRVVGGWKKESLDLFRPNNVEARHRSLGRGCSELRLCHCPPDWETER